MVLQIKIICGIVDSLGGESLKEKKSFGPKQVGERIRERRTELKLSMPELGRRLGVNKSTIQRYEADGADPSAFMIIDGLITLCSLPQNG